MLEAKKIAFTREKLYYYRVGHTTMSGGDFNGKVQHYLDGVRVSKYLKNMISGEQVELGKDNLVNIDKMIS